MTTEKRKKFVPMPLPQYEEMALRIKEPMAAFNRFVKIAKTRKNLIHAAHGNTCAIRKLGELSVYDNSEFRSWALPHCREYAAPLAYAIHDRLTERFLLLFGQKPDGIKLVLPQSCRIAIQDTVRHIMENLFDYDVIRRSILVLDMVAHDKLPGVPYKYSWWYSDQEE